MFCQWVLSWHQSLWYSVNSETWYWNLDNGSGEVRSNQLFSFLCDYQGWFAVSANSMSVICSPLSRAVCTAALAVVYATPLVWSLFVPQTCINKTRNHASLAVASNPLLTLLACCISAASATVSNFHSEWWEFAASSADHQRSAMRQMNRLLQQCSPDNTLAVPVWPIIPLSWFIEVSCAAKYKHTSSWQHRLKYYDCNHMCYNGLLVFVYQVWSLFSFNGKWWPCRTQLCLCVCVWMFVAEPWSSTGLSVCSPSRSKTCHECN